MFFLVASTLLSYAFLDPASATMLLAFAQNYAKNHHIPTLLITHDPFIVKHVGNRLWIFHSGQVSREFGNEKKLMNPEEFFQSIDYSQLSTM